MDPHINPPARLKLMTMLTAFSEVEFVTIRDELDISDSVLSKHLKALADTGYVRTRKGVLRGRRTTWIALTPRGRRSLSDHVAALRAIIADIE